LSFASIVISSFFFSAGFYSAPVEYGGTSVNKATPTIASKQYFLKMANPIPRLQLRSGVLRSICTNVGTLVYLQAILF